MDLTCFENLIRRHSQRVLIHRGILFKIEPESIGEDVH